jgi:hypothetical protein
MISSYRLGELVMLSLALRDDDRNAILAEYPNSIGSKYILERTNNPSIDTIDTITKIVLETVEANLNVLPNDISDSTVIHLRLGDVVGGNEWHEESKMPLNIDYIKSLVASESGKKYVIGKCFFATTSSRNYEECICLSNEYLQNVLNQIQAEHYESGNADIDLCCAVKSKIFIQGRGFYSKLIVEIRKKLNLNSIETSTEINI